MEEAYQTGKKIGVIWYYDADNETAMECAEDFKEDLILPFELRPLAEKHQ